MAITAFFDLDRFTQQWRVRTGFQALLGPSSNECQLIERKIASLDTTNLAQLESRITTDAEQDWDTTQVNKKTKRYFFFARHSIG